VSGEAFLKQPEGKGFAQVGEAMFLTAGTDGGVGIAIRKDEADLRARVNEALAAIMADGTYDALAASTSTST
jgi:ABC-type amino acid transport substrate-binding protein